VGGAGFEPVTPALINQGPRLLDGEAFSWSHGVLNFVVPFCVSSFSGGRNEWRNRQATGY
jgi:hypothetical protein